MQKIQLFVATLLSFGLAGCGGGGDSGTPTQPPVKEIPVVKISGAAVKGPLAATGITVYQLDRSKPNFKSEALSTVTSDNKGQFSGLQLTDPQAEFYVLEANTSSGSLDLLTNQPAYADQLSGIFSLSQLKAGPVYLTPLSQLVTLQVQLALQAGNTATLSQLQQQASSRTSQLFGFEQITAEQIHSLPALFVGGSDKSSVYKFRRVNETIGALAYRLMQQGQLKYSQAMSTLAEDALDGVLDGLTHKKPLTLAEKLPNYLPLILGAQVNQLPIPAASDPLLLTDLIGLLVKEAALTGHQLTTAELDTVAALKLKPLSRDTDGDELPDLIDPDDDNDKVPDEADAFPLDPIESTDTDLDGIGDNADEFDTDAACWRKSDGDADGCFLTQIVTFPAQRFQTDHANELFITDLENNRLLRMDLTSKQFKPVIQFSAAQDLQAVTYLPAHQLTYLLMANGEIFTLNVTSNEAKSWLKLNRPTSHLHAAGNYLLVQAEGGYYGSLLSINQAGQIAAQGNGYIGTHSFFDAKLSRLYHFRDGISPNDLQFITVSQSDGLFGDVGESPYHGAYSIVPPIRVSADGAKVVLGSGDIYLAPELTHVGNIGMPIVDAHYLPDGQLITLTVTGYEKPQQSNLLRHSSTDKLLELQSFSGSAKALLKTATGFSVLVEGKSALQIKNYQPSDDVDGDGIHNIDDDFPMDKAAAKDSDQDGYPDAWNNGMTAADSTTGLKLDAFPQDAACQLAAHGTNGRCDPNKSVPNFTASQMIQDVAGIIYSLSPEHKQVFRWSAKERSYLNPLFVGKSGGFGQDAPVQMAVNATQQRLYLVYPTGRITYVDLTDSKEKPFAGIGVGGNIAVIGQYLLGQDGTGAWASHHIFDVNGTKTASRDWNHQSSTTAWSSKLSRLFYLSNHSPQDIMYEDITVAGKIAGSGETPYHGDYYFGGQLFLSPESTELLTGSGLIFHPETLQFVKTLEQPNDGTLQHAYWVQGQLVTATTRHVQIRDHGSHRFRLQFSFEHNIAGMFQLPDQMIVALITASGMNYQIISMADLDQDGLPGWWEQYYQLNNNDAADAQRDTDQDGLTNLEEYQQATDPNLSDTDNDGLSDGSEVKTHQTKPLIGDTDQDGLLDGTEVNIHKTNPLQADSDQDGLSDRDEVETHRTNPLSNDSDQDGLPDLWEVEVKTNPLLADANVDADNDGLTHAQEYAAGTKPFNPDTDGDGLTDGRELNAIRTNPLKADTDGDKIPDGWEVGYELNPLLATDALLDFDQDLFSNLEEYYFSTAPDNAGIYPQATSWTTDLGSSARRAYQPMRLNVSNFSQKWQVSLPLPEVATTSLAVKGDTLVLTKVARHSSGEVLALNSYTGQIRWQKQITGSDLMFLSSPTIADDQVFIQSGGHSSAFVRAYELQTGQLQFKTSYGNQWSSYGAPAVDDQNVYIAGGYYGGAAAFNRSTGERIWTQGLVQEDNWGPTLSGQHLLAYPGQGRSQLSLLAKNSGNIDRNIRTAEDSNYGQRGVYPQLGYRNDVYLIDNNQLKRIDLQTGEIGFKVNLNYAMPGIAVTPTELFVVKDGILSVFDDSTGALLWSWEADSGAQLTSSPLVSSQYVFVASDSTTYAIDRKTKNSVWSIAQAGKLALDGQGTLFILSASKLTAINLIGDTDSDGMPDWWELAYGLNMNSAADRLLDKDNDNLTNFREYQLKTRPDLADTDNDSLTDDLEVNTHRTDPNKEDTDGDGLKDGAELQTHFTNPLLADTDADGFSDTEELLIYNTDPNSAASVPQPITSYQESFEQMPDISAAWNFGTETSRFGVDRNEARTGNSSLRSGEIAHSQHVAVSYRNLFAEGTFSFYFKLSSEQCCDALQLQVNGELVFISTSQNWTYHEIKLPRGRHEIKWIYSKDGSGSSGTDSLYLDDVKFTGKSL